jgi:uncharacterized protein
MKHTIHDSSSSLLEEVVRRLAGGINPLRIYLFGSRARQDADPDSDYDLLTVVSHSNEPGHRRSQQARHLLRGLNASFDIIVLTSEEWSRQLRSGVSLANAVVKEGKLIHESWAWRNRAELNATNHPKQQPIYHGNTHLGSLPKQKIT